MRIDPLDLIKHSCLLKALSSQSKNNTSNKHMKNKVTLDGGQAPGKAI